MRTDPTHTSCENPSYFSEVLTPAITKRLASEGTVAGVVLDHTTALRPFFEGVSHDLCDDGTIGKESAKNAIRFITRSSTTAMVASGAATLALAGLAVGSPVLAIGAGIIGLAVLPPLAERVTFGALRLGQEFLSGVRRESDG